jgi:hypothetical protein
MQNTKEFTESWLQALSLSAGHETARKIRPWITDIGWICASELVPEQSDAALRVWDYCQANGLLDLLTTTPFWSLTWRFDEDEFFEFDRSAGEPKRPMDFDTWRTGLGIEPTAVLLNARATQTDWTNLLRREAVRRSKPLSVTAIPQGSMVEVPCTAQWREARWRIQFEQPSWLDIEQVGIFYAKRPKREKIEELILGALDAANRSFKPTAKTGFAATDALWMSCVEPLYDWHRSVLLTNEAGVSPWVRRVWNCVWPVIYRERNRLKGPCDLQLLRKELAECFASAPTLTQWMFIFARLVCELQIGNGIGIAGDWTDSAD